MNTPIEHAKHNRKACDYLHEKGEFPDWVITTAFYSAMHFVYAAIFPFEEVGVKYSNFQEYFNRNKTTKDTQHSVTLDLVQKKFDPKIAAKYKQIKDCAHTARYQDYSHPPEVVKIIRLNLKSIEEYCTKKIETRDTAT